MRLTGKGDLASGWYRVDGEVTVDANVAMTGLPLTLLSAQTVMPCKKRVAPICSTAGRHPHDAWPRMDA